MYDLHRTSQHCDHIHAPDQLIFIKIMLRPFSLHTSPTREMLCKIESPVI